MASRIKKDGTDETGLPVHVEMTGEGDRPDAVRAYAYGPDGRFLAHADLSAGKGELRIPSTVSADRVKVYLGAPMSESAAVPSIETLRMKGAVKASVEGRTVRAVVDAIDWGRWLTCACDVRGRVIKAVTLADGTSVDRPVCNSRVHIYEVDSWPWFIDRLPDPEIHRLRDDILAKLREVAQPIPLPHIGPVPPEPIEMEHLHLHSAERMQAAPALTAPASFSTSKLEMMPTVEGLRDHLKLLRPDIQYWFCWWPWLEPWFRYSQSELAVVDVDDDGYFSTTIDYPCFGDHPDLYFEVEQHGASGWKWIYRPPVRCNIYWDYPCGSLVTIRVTDPTAHSCESDLPIDDSNLGDAWVMPARIGGLLIRGHAGTDVVGDALWVRTDGLQEDGISAMDPAHGVPFGGIISLQLGYSNAFPVPAVSYYRLSYRRQGTTAWHHLTTPVSRYYEKHVPGHFVSYPTVQLGPDSIGGHADLFRFRPDAPPAPSPADPTGTTTNWPKENVFGDIYHGFLDTTTIELPPGETGGSHGA